MGMMKTITMLRRECMAEKGKRKWAVCNRAGAILFIEDKGYAEDLANSLSRTSRKRTSPTLYWVSPGPDHWRYNLFGLIRLGYPPTLLTL